MIRRRQNVAIATYICGLPAYNGDGNKERSADEHSKDRIL